MKKKTDYKRIVALLFFIMPFLFASNTLSAVTITVPADNATNVPLNTTAITATFSGEMDDTTISEQTFLVTIQTEFENITVEGDVTYSNPIATFTPAQRTGIEGPTSDLNPNTTYVVTLTTGIKESGGTPLASNYQWSFKTGSTSTSKVVSTSPANNAINVPVMTKTITATFSEDIFNEGTFTVTSEDYDISTGVGILKGTISYDSTSKTVTFTLTDSLEINKTYYASVTPEKLEIGSKPGYTWSFTTGEAVTCDKGDLNCDETVDLTDAILGLQICAGMTPTPVYYAADVNADSKIGLEDVLYVLRKVLGVVTR